MAAKQVREILIKVDTKDSQKLNQISDAFGRMNKSVKSTSQNVNFLTRAFQGYLGLQGLRTIMNMSDEMQNLSNRLKITAKAGEDTSVTMQRLLQLANETNQSLGGVAETYNRLASSLKGAGASANALLGITKVLINSFRVSGSTTTETVNTMIQLSQAFASGEVRGQELRSVLEQNLAVAELLRQKYGGDIFKEAAKGAITAADVLEILLDNAERLNRQAAVLAPTFQQTLTKGLNVAQFALYKLNEQLGLSEKFGAAVTRIFDKMQLILVGIGVTVSMLAYSYMPALILAFQKFYLGAYLFATRNPLGAVLLALSVIVISTNDTITDFTDKLRNAGAWAVYLRGEVQSLKVEFMKLLALPFEKLGLLSKADKGYLKDQERILANYRKLAADLGKPTAQGFVGPEISNDLREARELVDRMREMNKASEKLEKIKTILGAINKEWLAGSIGVGEYNRKLISFELYKVNREFKEGKYDIFAYREALSALNMQEFNRLLQQGQISFRDLTNVMREDALGNLNLKLEAGKVSLIEYNAELIKLTEAYRPDSALMAGTVNYMTSIGTLSENIAAGITSTFTLLENTMSEFIKTGKFNFADFTKAILDDLTKIITRALIIRPLANGILDFATGGVGGSGGGGGSGAGSGGIGSSPIAFAKGGAFDGPIQKFAKGGVVTSPTSFGYGSGKTGLMGESGPEGILPLRRGRGGDLGVAASVTPVSINIINNANADVTQTERTGPSGEKTIELMIKSKVEEGIRKGSYDKAMQSTYGLNRKGS